MFTCRIEQICTRWELQLTVIFLSFLCRLHNHNPPTYETGSTRKFMLGRTDTIRSASIASSEFVKAMVSPNKTVSSEVASEDQIQWKLDFSNLLGKQNLDKKICGSSKMSSTEIKSKGKKF